MPNALAQRGHDVEVVSVFRHASAPVFSVDEAVHVRSLLDVGKRAKRRGEPGGSAVRTWRRGARRSRASAPGPYSENIRAAFVEWYPRLDAVATITERDAQDYRALSGDRLDVRAIPNAVPRLHGVQGGPDPHVKVAIAAGRRGQGQGHHRGHGVRTTRRQLRLPRRTG